MLVPQITGGVLALPPVIVNVSVWHWVAVPAPFPAADDSPPFTSNTVDVVTVFGPAMLNVLKSIRSC